MLSRPDFSRLYASLQSIISQAITGLSPASNLPASSLMTQPSLGPDSPSLFLAMEAAHLPLSQYTLMLAWRPLELLPPPPEYLLHLRTWLCRLAQLAWGPHRLQAQVPLGLQGRNLSETTENNPESSPITSSIGQSNFICLAIWLDRLQGTYQLLNPDEMSRHTLCI
ncbi:unnamed protein product [Protopolystoma xenopodis]|uniref:Uncharacterized protein n=1 Tax=Protopolystoma xenopodis TaxID=117903 RepID=A0A448WC20_9PLAT|nr:unnamed protein product [Protopolystoma xenopodis]